MPPKTREDIFLEKLSDLLRANRANRETEPPLTGLAPPGRVGRSNNESPAGAADRASGHTAPTDYRQAVSAKANR
jgi:hypothetical protein